MSKDNNKNKSQGKENKPSLPIAKIKEAIEQYKKEELPYAESPFHYEAEIWSGMKHFIRWLEAKK